MTEPNNATALAEVDDDGDWEEWDAAAAPFWVHCAAGSAAGLTEHALVFPLDTIRTNLQVACSLCAQRNHLSRHGTTALAARQPRRPGTGSGPLLGRLPSPLLSAQSAAASGTAASAAHGAAPHAVSMWGTIRGLMSEPLPLAAAAASDAGAASALGTTPYAAAGSATIAWARFARLWRGVQTVLVGCVPAHALYFSSYEAVKALTSAQQSHDSGNGQHLLTTTTWWGASLAGAAAVTGHDLVMTPLDTLKQRLQLGHYGGSATRALSAVAASEEGLRRGLYRSFGVTLATNVPYGMILVATQETIKARLLDWRRHRPPHEQHHQPLRDWQVVLLASSAAGFVASAATTPLDRIKTCLQTQQHVPTCWRSLVGECPKTAAATAAAMATTTTGGGTAATAAPASTTAMSAATSTTALQLPRHRTVADAARFIYRHEGLPGFFRGLLPRVLSHTPAAAISWTTYEAAKAWLLRAHESAAFP